MHTIIKELLDKTKQTPADFATRIGIGRNAVYFWIQPTDPKLPRPAHLRVLLSMARLPPEKEVEVWRALGDADMERVAAQREEEV